MEDKIGVFLCTGYGIGEALDVEALGKIADGDAARRERERAEARLDAKDERMMGLMDKAMGVAADKQAETKDALSQAADRAARAIPPVWPLASSVAVNPFLGQTGDDLTTTAARLRRVAGAPVTRPRSAWPPSQSPPAGPAPLSMSGECSAGTDRAEYAVTADGKVKLCTVQRHAIGAGQHDVGRSKFTGGRPAAYKGFNTIHDDEVRFFVLKHFQRV